MAPPRQGEAEPRLHLFFFCIALRLFLVSAFAQRLCAGVDIYVLRTKLEYFANFGICTLFPNFLRYLFPLEVPRRLMRVCNLLAVGTALLLFMPPVWFVITILNFYNVLFILYAVWVFVILSLALRRHRPKALLIFIGYLIFLLANAAWLVYLYYPSLGMIDMMGFGSIAIVLCNSVVLSYRFARLSTRLKEEVAAQMKCIAEQNRELERLMREKTDVFINFNHETKTPLILMKNYLDRYIREKGDDGSLAVIRCNVDKLLADVTNSLDLEALIRNHAFYKHDRPLSFTCFVNEKVRLFIPTAERKGISLSMKDAPAFFVNIDPSALDRIFNNLFEKAVRYTERGGNIHVEVRERRGKIELIVGDAGRGIPPELHQKIFEPYYQISQIKGNRQGLGMGLSIVKKIMDGLGGGIRVESCPGEGSRFILTFSAADPPAGGEAEDLPPLSPPAEFETISLHPEAYMEGKDTILVMEDNKSQLAYLQEQLSGEYNVSYACSGREAMKKLEIMPLPQLILSDIMMDEMDGFEFLDAMLGSERHRSIPLLFLTALNQSAETAAGLARGAVDVLHKPIDMDELRLKIRSLIRNRKSQREAVLYEMLRMIAGAIAPAAPSPSDGVPPSPAEERCRQYGITRREHEIIDLLLQGLEYKKIAERAGISFNTVKQHVLNIYRKCSVQNKVELANILKKR